MNANTLAFSHPTCHDNWSHASVLAMGQSFVACGHTANMLTECLPLGLARGNFPWGVRETGWRSSPPGPATSFLLQLRRRLLPGKYLSCAQSWLYTEKGQLASQR